LKYFIGYKIYVRVVNTLKVSF